MIERGLETIPNIYPLLPVIGLAFSAAVRKLMGEKANWHCQQPGCDKSYATGFMQHASHFDHDKSQPYYDDPSNGAILCVEDHLNFHLAYRGQAEQIGLCEEANEHAINMLLNTEVHTNWWLEEND